MKLYKLTDQNGYTRAGMANALKWEVGITHRAEGAGVRLCTGDVIHAYTDPVLAVLMNPMHANIKNPLLWECEGDVVATDGCKVGVKELTIEGRAALPVVSTEVRIRFGIACAWFVCDSSGWRAWAKKWVSGADRSVRGAANAANAANAAYAVANAVANAAIAANAAAYAAYYAAIAAPSKKEDLIRRALAWAQTTESLDTLGELE